MQIRILVLKNDLKIDVSDDILRWIAYEKGRTGLDILVDQRETHIQPLTHKSFGIYATGKNPSGQIQKTEMYGLDNIKAQIRATGAVPEATYHAVVFLYDYENTELWRTSPGKVGHWTHFNELYPGGEFIEIATTHPWDGVGDVFRVLTHECRHMYVFRARRRNKPVPDVMDMTYVRTDCATRQPSPIGRCADNFPYFKEFEPLALDGNRATQDRLIAPYIAQIVQAPELTTWIDELKSMVAELLKKIQSLKDSENLVRFAEAIKRHEGWYVGSRSYRNLNPANFRYAPFIIELGAVGEDRAGVKPVQRGYAIFPTYDKGWEALLEFLRTARKNQLLAYRQYAHSKGRPNDMCTLGDFFQVYAPSSDENNPLQYAQSVADYIGNGVGVGTPLDKII